MHTLSPGLPGEQGPSASARTETAEDVSNNSTAGARLVGSVVYAFCSFFCACMCVFTGVHVRVRGEVVTQNVYVLFARACFAVCVCA
jgi:hypothetical protein